jgi:hypothetical protein
MGGPSWLTALLAVVMLLVAIYCAIRLVLGPIRHRRIEHDIDLVHIGMGVTMAGMLVPRLNPWAGPTWDTTWEIIFAVATAYFLARAVTSVVRPDIVAGHYLPHAVHSGAMLYMFVALSAMTSTSARAGMNMNEMGGASAPTAFAPTLALVLGLFMVGYSVLLINHTRPPTTILRHERAPLVAASASTSTPPKAATNPNPSLVPETEQLSSTSQQPLLAPQAATIYKIAMSLTMAYMLVTML